MKKFLAVLILIFTFQTSSWADDISDFEIEEMSIGNSVLDYFSKEKITSSIKETPYDDDEFYDVEVDSDGGTYDKYGFSFKKFDNKYLIYSIKGVNYLQFDECIKKKKLAINDIKKVLKNIKEESYTSNFNNKFGKSFAEVTDLIIEGGSIRVWCDNFDKNFEESKNWEDSLNIDISSKEYLFWLDNKAYQ